MKNKQLVIELHEGCMDPKDPIFEKIRNANQGTDREQAVVQWLIRKLTFESDDILIDQFDVIDCDCEVGD